MSRKGSGKNDSNDEQWPDENEADLLCNPLAEWDFDSASAKDTAPSGRGSGTNTYSDDDQRAADEDLNSVEQWDSEFASHPGPRTGGQQPPMRPVQQPRQQLNPQPGSYQPFPPGNQQNHMLPYPGNGRTNRPSANPPVQGRQPFPSPQPMMQQGHPQMMQQPAMNPAYRVPHQQAIQQQYYAQQQQQMRPTMQPAQFRGQPIQYPSQHPGQPRPPSAPQQSSQMGRGRAAYLPKSEYNNGSFHRPQGY